MKLTTPLNKPGHNLYRLYKYLWVLKRKRTLQDTKQRETLEGLGAKICRPDEVFTKPYDVPHAEDFFPPAAAAPQPMETLYSLSTNYKTLVGCSLPVLQNLCNSVVQSQLPAKTLHNVKECTDEEIDLFRDCILSSHLLDAYQKKLPLSVNREATEPVKIVRRDFGIPLQRKNELLSLSLTQCLDNISSNRLNLLCRPQILNSHVTASLRHNGKLARLSLPAPLSILSPTPLPPPFDPKDADLFIRPDLDEKTKRKVMRKQMTVYMGGPLQQPLPDIFPMSALSGSRTLDSYSHLFTKYVSNSKALFPHTVYFHHNEFKMTLLEDEFTALTLMNLFSHAVAYAYNAGVKINTAGTLSTPVVVQGVHTHLNTIQPAVFQLNTLGPLTQFVDEPKRTRNSDEGRTPRNIFSYNPVDQLYEMCHYNEEAKPEVTNLNTELLSILKAMHDN